MKTLRRAIAVGMVAAFATVAFAVQAPADHTEARLTLAIEPTTGPVGQTINAQLPAEAFEPSAGDECSASATANQIIGDALADFASGVALENIVAGILENATEDPSFVGTLDSILFPLVFADVATQEPLSDPSFWDPDTGQGSVVAPGTDVNTGDPLPRPAVYAIAGTCLGLNPDLLTDAVAAAVVALTDLLETAEAADVATLATCLVAAGVDPTAIEACIAAFVTATTDTLQEGVSDALASIVEAAVNQDPDVAWAALFCLTGDNFEPCPTGGPAPDGAGPAAPVQAVARFTG